MVWIEFLACVALIGFAGTRLSRYGDIIAEKTGLGRNWVGLVLLATVTSLPELVTGISAVTVAVAPDIAIGDVLGSCVFNLLILVVVDFLHREESLYTRAGRAHVLSAAFGVVLIGLAGAALLLAGHGTRLAIGHIGAYTPVILGVYFVAMRSVFLYERREITGYVGEVTARHPDIGLRQAAAGYAVAAALVITAGTWLPFIGEDIAVAQGWHESFVGTLFIAAATSAPELAVTIAAVRLGALDMAVANLLGSNLFDILIIAVDDLFYRDGPILAHVSPVHALSAFSAIVMTGAAIIGLFYRPAHRLARSVGWISVFLLAIYLLNGYALYRHGG